jgi:hypothetical protein
LKQEVLDKQNIERETQELQIEMKIEKERFKQGTLGIQNI